MPGRRKKTENAEQESDEDVNQESVEENEELEEQNQQDDQDHQDENENNNQDNQAQTSENFNATEETPILKRAKTEKEDEQADQENQDEFAKPEENKQTRVLFIRGIPFNTTEQDISHIVNPFGQITDSLLLLKQNTAFIELESEEVAQKVLNYFSSIQPTLKGQPIQFLTSNRDKIEHKARPDRSDSKEEKPPRRVILITITNKIYPIGIDVLQEVFQRCGTVHKIVTFTSKTGGFQAFIQYSNVSEAQEAMKTLDNQNIYSNCCTLSIQYSDLDDVNVRYNNEKTRDFTNPDLPTTAPPQTAPRNTPDNRGGFGNPTFRNQSAQFNNYRGGMQGTNFNGQPNFNQGGFNQGGFQGGFNQGGFNNQGGFQGGFNQPNPNFNQGGFNFVNPNTGYPAQANPANQSTVLHVTHLNPQECTLDVLFTLFGVYGDVQRVKIMFNKQDNALIQMATHEQCLNAIKFLNSLNLYGSQIHVCLSRNSYVSMPKQITPETEKYTKDFSNSTAHRYKGTGSKQYQHICAPSNSLHISNLAENTNEEQIKTVFSTYGTVTKVNLFTPPNTQVHMGVVEMATLEQAVDALIKLHNTNLNNQLLRVTFSQPKKRKIPNPTGLPPNQMMPSGNMTFNNPAQFNPYSQ